jgi:putative membrane protein
MRAPGTLHDRGPNDDPAPATRPESAVRDHLANERTLLAWQRTALGAVAIGFLVDRFALQSPGDATLGTLLGLALIAMGGALSLVGASRYVRTARQIDADAYRPATLAHLALTGAVVAGAIALGVFVLLVRG